MIGLHDLLEAPLAQGADRKQQQLAVRHHCGLLLAAQLAAQRLGVCLWGSYFSRIDSAAIRKPFRRGMFSRVGVVAGPALGVRGLSSTAMRDEVGRLLAT